MYEITVTTKFAAAHNLRSYKGNCEKVHGHNWKVKVTASFESLQGGIAMDFRELKKEAEDAVGEMDHENINELDYFKKKNPTSENIAKYIFDKIKKKEIPVLRVSVSETDDYTAVYRER